MQSTLMDCWTHFCLCCPGQQCLLQQSREWTKLVADQQFCLWRFAQCCIPPKYAMGQTSPLQHNECVSAEDWGKLTCWTVSAWYRCAIVVSAVASVLANNQQAMRVQHLVQCRRSAAPKTLAEPDLLLEAPQAPR